MHVHSCAPGIEHFVLKVYISSFFSMHWKKIRVLIYTRARATAVQEARTAFGRSLALRRSLQNECGSRRLLLCSRP